MAGRYTATPGTGRSACAHRIKLSIFFLPHFLPLLEYGWPRSALAHVGLSRARQPTHFHRQGGAYRLRRCLLREHCNSACRLAHTSNTRSTHEAVGITRKTNDAATLPGRNNDVAQPTSGRGAATAPVLAAVWCRSVGTSWTLELHELDGGTTPGKIIAWISSHANRATGAQALAKEILAERGLQLFPDSSAGPSTHSRQGIGYVCTDAESIKLAYRVWDDTAATRRHLVMLAARWIAAGFSADAAARRRHMGSIHHRRHNRRCPQRPQCRLSRAPLERILHPEHKEGAALSVCLNRRGRWRVLVRRC